MERELIFQKAALKEYNDWKKKDPKVAKRVKQLILAIFEQPFARNRQTRTS